jgi:hypothetical protein
MKICTQTRNVIKLIAPSSWKRRCIRTYSEEKTHVVFSTFASSGCFHLGIDVPQHPKLPITSDPACCKVRTSEHLSTPRLTPYLTQYLPSLTGITGKAAAELGVASFALGLTLVHIPYQQAHPGGDELKTESGGVSLRTLMSGSGTVCRAKVRASWCKEGPFDDGAGCCQLIVHERYQSVGWLGLVELMGTLCV